MRPGALSTKQYEMAVGMFDPGSVHMAHCGVGLPVNGDIDKLEILCMRNEPLVFSTKDKKNVVVRRTQAVEKYLLGNDWFYDFTHIGVEQQVIAKRGLALNGKARGALEAINNKCTHIAQAMFSLAEGRDRMTHPVTKKPCTKPHIFNDSAQRKIYFTVGGRENAPKNYHHRKKMAKDFAEAFFKQTAPVNNQWKRKWQELDKGVKADTSDCLWAAVTFILAKKRLEDKKSSKNKTKKKCPPKKVRKMIDLTKEENESEQEQDDEDDSQLRPPPLSSYTNYWQAKMGVLPPE